MRFQDIFYLTTFMMMVLYLTMSWAVPRSFQCPAGEIAMPVLNQGIFCVPAKKQ